VLFAASLPPLSAPASFAFGSGVAIPIPNPERFHPEDSGMRRRFFGRTPVQLPKRYRAVSDTALQTFKTVVQTFQSAHGQAGMPAPHF